MAPRGIVAAATASTFGAGLAAKGIGGAAKILPVTFVVIVATVTLYGVTARQWPDDSASSARHPPAPSWSGATCGPSIWGGRCGPRAWRC